MLQVFIQGNFVADFFSTEVGVYCHKQRYRVFVPPFGGLRGNVHGLTMARWKARGRLPIRLLNERFSLAITVEALWADIGRNRCAKKGGGSLSAQILGGKGRPPPTIFGIRKLESLSYRTMKKIAENCNQLSRVHQRYRQTSDDRQTTDGRSIAYSERGRKFTSAKNRILLNIIRSTVYLNAFLENYHAIILVLSQNDRISSSLEVATVAKF